MVTIKAVSYNGQSVGQPGGGPLAAEFGELGGVIGRADGNALVLPDPDRYVSRTHAMILFRNGRHVIRDLSSASPVYVNDRPLGNGNEATLADGDELRIGGYTLAVSEARFPAVGAAAIAHTDSGVIAPVAAAPPGVLASLPAAGARPVEPAAGPKDDPLGLFDSPAVPPRGGFASVPGAGGIPDDFSFSEVVPRAPAPAAGRPLPDDFDLGLGQAAGTDIDQLYGLGPGAGREPFPDDHPLGAAGGNAAGAASLDPLVAIGAVAPPKPVPASQPDDTPEIRSAFTPPTAQRAGALSPPAPAEAGNMVVSWNAPDEMPGGDGIKTMIVQSRASRARVSDTAARGAPPGPAIPAEPPARPSNLPSPAAPAPAPVEQMAPAGQAVPATRPGARTQPGPGLQPAQGQPPGAADVQPAARAQPVEPVPAADAELLRAFLAGAGVPDLDLRGPLTPQTMQTFGQLLREATQGTLDLLLSRAVIKREIHAEMTMIVTRENNPLKFSPNVEVALTHLLAPRGQGFMPPLAAMKDAHDDLRAHQFAFMAGMRAALAGVLQRFDPGQLERRLSGRSLVDTLLPANRKAKLWDLYAEMYSELTREAEDDFHAWFGKAFLAAYEAQLDKLAQGDEGGR